MAIEIERKFLVNDDSWKDQADEGLICRQGYMVSDQDKTVRVRIKGDQAFLTIKGATHGLSRSEYEYEIPAKDAESMFLLCGDVIEKTRYLVEHEGMTWEVDVFEGANAGLIMAEIELESEDQTFAMPTWAGKDVSGDKRYYNGCLARDPFSAWNDGN